MKTIHSIVFKFITVVVGLLALGHAARGVSLADISGGHIAYNITLSVPSEFPTLQHAFAALEGKTADTNAVITIQVANGTYSSSTPLVPPRAVGRNLEIVGNVTSPGSVILSFPNATSGILLTNGNVLRSINGFTIDGMASTPAGTWTAAVWLDTGSIATVGSAMVLKRFSYGLAAGAGSYASCVGATVRENVCGVTSNLRSCVNAMNLVAINNQNNACYANYGGMIVAYGATSSGTTYSAFFADLGGSVIR